MSCPTAKYKFIQHLVVWLRNSWNTGCVHFAKRTMKKPWVFTSKENAHESQVGELQNQERRLNNLHNKLPGWLQAFCCLRKEKVDLPPPCIHRTSLNWQLNLTSLAVWLHPLHKGSCCIIFRWTTGGGGMSLTPCCPTTFATSDSHLILTNGRTGFA